MLTLPNGQTVTVQVPSGALAGQVLTLSGLGKTLGPGSTSGNLYITLSILETQQQGSNIVSETDATYRAPWLVAPTQVAPTQVAPPSSITSMGTAMLPQGSGSFPFGPPSQPISSSAGGYIPPTGTFVSPPLPEQPKRRRSPAVAILLILLLLLFLCGGSFGTYYAFSGNWSSHNPTGTAQTNNGSTSSDVTPTSVLTLTATPTVAPTATPTVAPTATPTLALTPKPTATPMPTPTSAPPPNPMLVVTPTSIGTPGDGTNCSNYVPPVTCTVTLSESSNSQSSLNWNTSNGGINATFSPASGSLSPGQTIKVTITTSSCGGSWPLYFEASWNTVTVTYSCG